MTPRALVITAPGINCDVELANAFTVAGAEVESIPLIRLTRDPSIIDRFELIGLPGGFSYGDDVAAGRVLATLIRRSIYPALRAAVERGCPMIAPCNGFQVAVQAGLAEAGRAAFRANQAGSNRDALGGLALGSAPPRPRPLDLSLIHI